MSKIKKYYMLLIAVAILAFTIICVPTTVQANWMTDPYVNYWVGTTNKYTGSDLSIGTNVSMSLWDMIGANNTYCIQNGQRFGGKGGAYNQISFKVSGYVHINGSHAEGIAPGGKQVSTDSDTNNVMAAILGGSSLVKGYGFCEGGRTEANPAQAALYSYWNTWIGKSGKYFGFVACSKNDTYREPANAAYRELPATYLNKAKQDAASKNYEVTIYLLRATSISGNQEIIIVDIRNTNNSYTT